MLRGILLLNYFALLWRLAISEPAPLAAELPQQLSPFAPAYEQRRPLFLFKRQNCPADHTSCANLNAPEACCPSGTSCARDSAGKIACCPVNNVCTGSLGESATPTGGSSQLSSSAGGYIGTITVTSTAGVTGTPTSASPSVTNVVSGESTVPNPYYPFVYMPTSFANAAVCSSYIASCQSASTACFASLAGANGVTIGGVAGGTTQAGGTGIVQTSASAICSSLSLVACHGLQSSQCTSIGANGSGVIHAGAGPRETGCAAVAYIAAAGMAVGAMGIM